MKMVITLLVIISFSLFLLDCEEDKIVEPKCQGKNISFTSPVGAKKYIVGDTIYITWKSCGIDKFKLLTNWSEVIAEPVNVKTTHKILYKTKKPRKLTFKILDLYDNTVYDETDTLTISKKSNNKLIELIEPNGQKVYPINEPILVKWKDIFNKKFKVKVYISFSDGKDWKLLAENIKSSVGIGKYFLQNNDKQISNKCRVKIEDVTNTSIYDISDNSFAIFDPKVFDKDYFPLRVGNMWNWEKNIYDSWSGKMTKSYFQWRIVDSVNISGKKYFVFEIKDENNKISQTNYRIDENGIISHLNIQLSWPTGKYLLEEYSNSQYNRYLTVTEGDEKTWKNYSFYQWISGSSYTFKKNIGLESSIRFDDVTRISTGLRGYVINGVVYGDTTFVH